MTSSTKLLEKILLARSDQNVRFDDLCKLLAQLGFQVRVRGSHHIFYRDGIPEIVNLQPQGSGLAKAYQVRQIRKLILAHDLRLPETDE